MTTDADAWLDRQPTLLRRQTLLIRRLLSQARTDSRLRIFVVGCSIGRGVADEHSDVDAYLAVRSDDWALYADDAGTLLCALGDLTDSWHTKYAPEGKDPYQSTWALYADGTLLELNLASAPAHVQPRYDWVVLHDPDGRVGQVQEPRFASPKDVEDWSYEAWSTLLLCAKYLTRGSLWEALEMVHFVRTRIWRLWAAAERIQDPHLGLTAVFDSDNPAPPPRIEATHAVLDRASLAGAAVACAELLERLWPDAMASVGATGEAPPPIAAVVRRTLIGLGGRAAR